MNALLKTLLLGAAASFIATASASAMDAHAILTPPEIKWTAGPPSLPPGAQAATLFGNPGQEGLFALRLKLPKGYVIPPHIHPKPEIVTVISGVFRLGVGATADRDKAKPLPAGSFFAMHPGMTHYVFIDEDAVVQLNSVGPWGVVYANPKDDPRNK